MEESLRYEPTAGEHIDSCAQIMIDHARDHQRTICASFNDIELEATANSTVREIVNHYHAVWDQQQLEYEKTEEYRLEKERQRRFEEQAERAKEEGFLPFTFREGDGESNWKAFVANNQDDYGAGTMRYAARWAAYMEQAMRDGEKLENIVDRTSHEADLEGVSGFMHSMAGGVLFNCWAYGDQLKAWKESHG